MTVQQQADTFHRAALERLDDTRRLLDSDRWTGAAYLAGRAVESMQRALLRLKTADHVSGHDLRHLLKSVGQLGMLHDQEQDQLLDQVNIVAILWHNNLRYMDEQAFARRIKASGQDRGLRGGPVKPTAKRLVEASESVINRGEIVWHRFRKK